MTREGMDELSALMPRFQARTDKEKLIVLVQVANISIDKCTRKNAYKYRSLKNSRSENSTGHFRSTSPRVGRQ